MHESMIWFPFSIFATICAIGMVFGELAKFKLLRRTVSSLWESCRFDRFMTQRFLFTSSLWVSDIPKSCILRWCLSFAACMFSWVRIVCDDITERNSPTPRAGGQQKALLQNQSITLKTKKHLENGYWRNLIVFQMENTRKYYYTRDNGIGLFPKAKYTQREPQFFNWKSHYMHVLPRLMSS